MNWECGILATGPPGKSQGSQFVTKEGRNWLAWEGFALGAGARESVMPAYVGACGWEGRAI